MNEPWHIRVTEYYSGNKKEWTVDTCNTCMSLREVLLNVKSQSQKSRYWMLSFYALLEQTKLTYRDRNQESACWGQYGGESWLGKFRKELSRVLECSVLFLDWGHGYMSEYMQKFIYMDQNSSNCPKSVHLITYKLCLSNIYVYKEFIINYNISPT